MKYIIKINSIDNMSVKSVEMSSAMCRKYITFQVLGGEEPFQFAGGDDLEVWNNEELIHFVRRYQRTIKYRNAETDNVNVVFAAFGGGKCVHD